MRREELIGLIYDRKKSICVYLLVYTLFEGIRVDFLFYFIDISCFLLFYVK